MVLRCVRLTWYFLASSVDLGSGDQATNSAQTIVLSNAGGDEITWQSAATQPWLLLSPPNGTIAPEQQMQVTLAADRSGLKVGSYTASVDFHIQYRISYPAGQVAGDAAATRTRASYTGDTGGTFLLWS